MSGCLETLVDDRINLRGLVGQMLSRRVLTIPDWAAISGLEQVHTGWPECDSEARGCQRRDVVREPNNVPSIESAGSAVCKPRAISFPAMTRDNGVVFHPVVLRHP
ncbi:hypothetical protein IG631_11172 [Alternaria alternata]|nr:hypothetical protein IG631_11172 [Alternaria alternata]